MLSADFFLFPQSFPSVTHFTECALNQIDFVAMKLVMRPKTLQALSPKIADVLKPSNPGDSSVELRQRESFQDTCMSEPLLSSLKHKPKKIYVWQQNDLEGLQWWTVTDCKMCERMKNLWEASDSPIQV